MDAEATSRVRMAGFAAVALPDLTGVRRADVYKAGALAATLTRGADGVEFQYTTQWLRDGGPAVASTLPLTKAPTIRGGGALPAYFAGLLPEGRRLGALQRAIKTSADDELSLLLGVGADSVGDVQVVPEGDAPLAVTSRISVDDIGGMRFRKLLLDLGIAPERVALPGVQDKTSVAMLNLPVSRAGERYLLKLSPVEYPHLVENEMFFLRAADLCGDRPPADKYLLPTEEIFAALARICTAPRIAARDLVRQLTFAIISGNGDAHAKNFSVLQGMDGETRVSPAYDVPSTLPYGDTTLALALNNRRAGEPTAKDVVALGATLGLPEKAVRRVIADVLARVDLWLGDVDDLPYDLARRRKLRRSIDDRSKMLSS